ncbi:flagellar biosynthesis anti-sigma factor FlgM [Melioribacter sp. OK-6-Me]|uniref:flagellar biosynthesis anti-sigma factor FlgM n=1 Tax=unclassified Melioribacter TaxID=2627329 RepID=UPI003ED95C48
MSIISGDKVDIKGISNNTTFTHDPNQLKKVSVKQPESKDTDKIEISSTARELAKNEAASKKLEEIKQKISSKFYDSDEVINKVAEAILKELKES